MGATWILHAVWDFWFGINVAQCCIVYCEYELEKDHSKGCSPAISSQERFAKKECKLSCAIYRARGEVSEQVCSLFWEVCLSIIAVRGKTESCIHQGQQCYAIDQICISWSFFCNLASLVPFFDFDFWMLVLCSPC